MNRLLIAAIIVTTCAASNRLFATDKIIKEIRNSGGLSEFIDLDGQGNAIGRKEVLSDEGKINSALYAMIEDVEVAIPIPNTFSNIEAFRMSQTKEAVGFAGRAPGNSQGNMQAAVWNLTTQLENGTPGGMQIALLPHPKSYRASCGFDISADGKRVSGYVIGRDPPRMQPCVWEKSNTKWQPTVLTTLLPHNPYLLGGKVVINDAGTMIAANLLVDNEGQRSNHVFRWKKNDRKWERKLVSKQGFRIANINDRGDIAGTLRVGHRKRGCIVKMGAELKTFDPLPGDVSVELFDINNSGIAVGISDDPPGPNGGTQGIVIHNERMRLLKTVATPGVKPSYSSLNAVADNNRAAGYAIVPSAGPSAIESTAAIIVKLSGR